MKKHIKTSLVILLLIALVITLVPIKTPVRAKEKQIKTKVTYKLEHDDWFNDFNNEWVYSTYCEPVQIEIINKPKEVISIKHKIVLPQDSIYSITKDGKIKYADIFRGKGYAVVETKIKYKDAANNEKLKKCYCLVYGFSSLKDPDNKKNAGDWYVPYEISD